MKLFDDLPRIAKLILQFFFGGIISGVYRIIKGATEGNVVVIVVGVLALVTGIGNVIFWIVDFVTLLLHDKFTVLV
ncbi:hypothetical protein [Acholeplasma hippikon]|uniref:Uncharacterized protein n=1 Tax=Acholeplasma hippikon TaxID=264636 RepID=A0A449BL71_9MOLU|nr:hypothetical protein [Acholeplasma hippikon]VEU83216.1 Uncharacterised protein [Acholeplasma hippikon]